MNEDFGQKQDTSLLEEHLGTESSQVFMQRGTISGQEGDDGENGWEGDEDVRGL